MNSKDKTETHYIFVMFLKKVFLFISNEKVFKKQFL